MRERYCPVHLGSTRVCSYMRTLKNFNYTGNRGQPSLDIPAEQIEFLLTQRFSVRQIANLLCPVTVQRRMRMYGVSVRNSYSSLSATQVDSLVRNVIDDHPHAGYRLVRSYISDQGIILTEIEVRESQNRVDPVGVAMRWS